MFHGGAFLPSIELETRHDLCIDEYASNPVVAGEVQACVERWIVHCTGLRDTFIASSKKFFQARGAHLFSYAEELQPSILLGYNGSPQEEYQFWKGIKDALSEVTQFEHPQVRPVCKVAVASSPASAQLCMEFHWLRLELERYLAMSTDAERFLGHMAPYAECITLSAMSSNSVTTLADAVVPICRALRMIWVSSECYGIAAPPGPPPDPPHFSIPEKNKPPAGTPSIDELMMEGVRTCFNCDRRRAGRGRFLQFLLTLSGSIARSVAARASPLRRNIGSEMLLKGAFIPEGRGTLDLPAPTFNLRDDWCECRRVCIEWLEQFLVTANEIAASTPDEGLWWNFSDFDPGWTEITHRESCFVEAKCLQLTHMADSLFTHWMWYCAARDATDKPRTRSSTQLKLEDMRLMANSEHIDPFDPAFQSEWNLIVERFEEASQAFVAFTGVPAEQYWKDPCKPPLDPELDEPEEALSTVEEEAKKEVPLHENLVVVLEFNPPTLALVGPVMPKQGTIRSIAEIMPKRCSTTPGQGLQGSKRFDETDFEVRVAGGQTYWYAELPGSWCSVDMGESGIMLAILDALEGEEWLLKGSTAMASPTHPKYNGTTALQKPREKITSHLEPSKAAYQFFFSRRNPNHPSYTPAEEDGAPDEVR